MREDTAQLKLPMGVGVLEKTFRKEVRKRVVKVLGGTILENGCVYSPLGTAIVCKAPGVYQKEGTFWGESFALPGEKEKWLEVAKKVSAELSAEWGAEDFEWNVDNVRTVR